ncbi:hypothetical protein D3C76_1274390 [compost metagenome]
MVDQLLGDPGLAGDFLHSRTGQAFFGELHARSREQAIHGIALALFATFSSLYRHHVLLMPEWFWQFTP